MRGGAAAAVPIRRATARDAAAVIEVLTRAFDDDPVINWLVRQDADRSEAFQRFFAIAVQRLTVPHEEVHLTGDGSGAALWMPPGTWPVDDAVTEALLPDFSAVFGEDKLERSLQGMALMEAHHPEEPHRYLLLLGVHPSRHNQGVGSALLASMLQRCDAARVPAYLEASSPRNVPLYERHGFEVTDTVHLPGGGPPLWLMWRRPR